jgi:hypothetical protein
MQNTNKKSILTRLSFIKYLYTFAIEQSYKPEPFGSISILIFHDAIESFNILALEYKADILKEINYIRKKPTDPNFMEYWDILQLTQKESINRFNKARVNFKHHGNLPSKLDIESFRASITNFFEENTQSIFNINFSDLSLIDLIESDETRINLKEAEKLLKENNTKESILKSAIAFSKMIRDSSAFDIKFGESLRLFSNFRIGHDNESQELRNYLNKLKKSIESIQVVLRYTLIGIDYRKYLKYLSIIPDLQWLADGSYNVYWDMKEYAREDAEYCINFVIESAVIIQQYADKLL